MPTAAELAALTANDTTADLLAAELAAGPNGNGLPDVQKVMRALMAREAALRAQATVRCAVGSDTSLSAFAGVTGGTPVDGVTCVAGDRVLLFNQTTPAENGIYVVGAVAGGVAPLTRAADMPAASALPRGRKIDVLEGTLWANTYWKCTAAAAGLVGTDDPAFYPRVCKATVTLAAGIKNLGLADGFALLSTTKSSVHVTRNTANTSTATTGGYAAPVANRTAGKGATVLRVVAQAADGTTNTADISTVDVTVVNW